MRNLQFTHEEIELLEKALKMTSSNVLQAAQLFPKDTKHSLIEEAEKFTDIKEAISSGNKDI